MIRPHRSWIAPSLGGVASAGLLLVAFTPASPLLTPDQAAYRLYQEERYQEAAQAFADPMWKGVALYQAGEFETAAGLFAGYDTAEAAYNQGNALALLGKYPDAAARYQRALELQPGWEDARINRKIALARAEALRTEGGEMTGGMLAADEYVFSKNESSPSGGDEEVAAETGGSDAENRAIWLRQVQTKPADFLRSKFAYQYATDQLGGDDP